MTTAPSNQIDQKAAEWAAKMDAGAVSAEQQAAFEAWLAEDLRHMGAYLRVQAALAQVERLGAAAQRRNSRRAGAWIPLQHLFQNRRPLVLGGAIAAIFAAVVFGAAWKASSYDTIFETNVGQTKLVTLPDGSSTVLNTDTKVAVHYTLFARDIALYRGEALFDVAKNKLRRFVVKSANIRVRAVGTSFTVSNLTSRPFEVMVREGVIELTSPRAPSPIAVHAGERAIGLTNGRFALEAVEAGQVARELAWLEGRIFFRRQTLASAAKEFERYSKLRIIIDDPIVAAKTVTGTYTTTDPVGFANAVSVFLDLKVERDGNTLHLSQKER